MNKKAQFKVALKRYLNTHSFYSVEEFLTITNDSCAEVFSLLFVVWTSYHLLILFVKLCVCVCVCVLYLQYFEKVVSSYCVCVFFFLHLSVCYVSL
jgi:hypothetical protein